MPKKASNPETTEKVKNYLEANQSEDDIRRATQHTRKRAKACLAVDGDIFEHMLKKKGGIIVDEDDDVVDEGGDTIGETIEIETENETIEEENLENVAEIEVEENMGNGTGNVGIEDTDTEISITSSISSIASDHTKKPKKTGTKPAAPVKKAAAKPKRASRQTFGLRKISEEDEIETMEFTGEENLEEEREEIVVENTMEKLESESEDDEEITFRVDLEVSKRNYEEGLKAIENLEKWEKEAKKEERNANRNISVIDSDSD